MDGGQLGARVYIYIYIYNVDYYFVRVELLWKGLEASRFCER
jgi:hypothetical protein